MIINNYIVLGPSAHLFHSVHEQNYVAHVIRYAADLKNYANGSEQINLHYTVLVISMLGITTIYMLTLCKG